MIEDSGANCVITSSDLLDIFENIKEETNENLLILSDSSDISNNLSIEDLLKDYENKKINPANTYDSDVCFWLYSSGSTGPPKGTLHIHKNLISTANSYAKEVCK